MTAGGGGGDTWTNNPHKAITSQKISEHNKGKHPIPPALHQRIIELARQKKTIIVDKKSLEQDIKNFMPIEDICKKYSFSRRTFYTKCQKLFNMTPTEIRGSKLKTSNSMKIYIDKDQLHQLLKQEKSLLEMAAYFNVSKETVRRNIVQYYGKNLKEVRKDVKSEN